MWVISSLHITYTQFDGVLSVTMTYTASWCQFCIFFASMSCKSCKSVPIFFSDGKHKMLLNVIFSNSFWCQGSLHIMVVIRLILIVLLVVALTVTKMLVLIYLHYVDVVEVSMYNSAYITTYSNKNGSCRYTLCWWLWRLAKSPNSGKERFLGN